MIKSEFLQIRMSPEDRERLKIAASAQHLDSSTWARKLILDQLERWEDKRKLRAAVPGDDPRQELP